MGVDCERILVSACLLGMNCRYCGGGCEDERAAELLAQYCLLPVCPEQLGGLPTPREPDEILNGRVIGRSGQDNTEAFELGAREALRAERLPLKNLRTRFPPSRVIFKNCPRRRR